MSEFTKRWGPLAAGIGLLVALASMRWTTGEPARMIDGRTTSATSAPQVWRECPPTKSEDSHPSTDRRSRHAQAFADLIPRLERSVSKGELSEDAIEILAELEMSLRDDTTGEVANACLKRIVDLRSGGGPARALLILLLQANGNASIRRGLAGFLSDPGEPHAYVIASALAMDRPPRDALAIEGDLFWRGVVTSDIGEYVGLSHVVPADLRPLTRTNLYGETYGLEEFAYEHRRRITDPIEVDAVLSYVHHGADLKQRRAMFDLLPCFGDLPGHRYYGIFADQAVDVDVRLLALRRMAFDEGEFYSCVDLPLLARSETHPVILRSTLDKWLAHPLPQCRDSAARYSLDYCSSHSDDVETAELVLRRVATSPDPASTDWLVSLASCAELGPVRRRAIMELERDEGGDEAMQRRYQALRQFFDHSEWELCSAARESARRMLKYAGPTMRTRIEADLAVFDR